MSHQFGNYFFATASEALEAAKNALAYLKEYEETGSKMAAKNYHMMRNSENAISLYTKKVEQGY